MKDDAPPFTLDPAAELAFLKNAFNHLDEGFSIYDVDLHLVAWNDRFNEIIEFPEDLMYVGAPMEAHFRCNAERGEYGPGDVDEQVAERMELAKTFQSHCFERERPNGMVLEIRGNPIPGGGFITVYKDVTDRARAEAALKESHDKLEERVAKRTAELARLNTQMADEIMKRRAASEALEASERWIRLVADAVPVLIGYVDSTRIYRFANRRYEEWFGLTPDQIIGRPARELLGDALYADLEQFVDLVLTGEQVSREFTLTTNDDREIEAVVTYLPHFTPHEPGVSRRVQGYFILGQDVTDRKRADGIMRQAQKMEAVGQLSAGLAHDFNNLLTVIIGNLALAQELDELTPNVAPLVDPALDAARRGAALAKRLLSFSRQSPLEPRVYDPRTVVRGMRELLRRSLGRTIELGIETSGAPWTIQSDPNELENAILNLAINSRDAMPDGGSLKVSVESRSLDRRFTEHHPELEPGDWVVISVADTGAGMAADVVERAFEPFFTRKDGGKGSGLGLSMVYGFARQSEGLAEIESREGEGTAVRLYLPRHKGGGEMAVLEPCGVAQGEIPTGDETVLVVEDEPAVRRLAADLLKGLGYDVLEAWDGHAAVSLIAGGERPGLLLTDVDMPGGLDGIELAETVLRLVPDARVLLMTGNPEKALRRGIDGEPPAIVPKPFEKRDLACMVRQALDGKLDSGKLDRKP